MLNDKKFEKLYAKLIDGCKMKYKRGVIHVWKAFDNEHYYADFTVCANSEKPITWSLPDVDDHHIVTDKKEAFRRGVAFADSFDISRSIRAIRADEKPRPRRWEKKIGCCQHNFYA